MAAKMVVVVVFGKQHKAAGKKTEAELSQG